MATFVKLMNNDFVILLVVRERWCKIDIEIYQFLLKGLKKRKLNHIN